MTTNSLERIKGIDGIDRNCISIDTIVHCIYTI